MTVQQARAALAAQGGTAPPTSFRIFNFGTVATTKGDFVFDKKAASLVIADWTEYGNDLCIDYEHRAVDPDARAGDGKAAGWFSLQVRNDGLYAVDVKWTPQAATQIANKEWRFYSPTFEFDKKSGRILSLVNVALTNIPATKNLPPLVAAAKGHRGRHACATTLGGRLLTTKNEDPMPKNKIELTKVALTEEEMKLDAKLADAPPMKKTKKVAKVDDADLDDVDADDVDAAADDVDAADDDVDAADDDTSDDDDADTDDSDDATTDDVDAADGDDDDDKAPPFKKTKKVAKKTSRAGLTRADRTLAELQALTGQSDLRGLVGAVKAMKQSNADVVKLSQEVAEMKRGQRRERVKGMVESAIKAMKLTPAQRDAFVKLGMRDPRELKGLLDTMPARVRSNESSTVSLDESGRPLASGLLTPTERVIASKCGSLEQYVAAKKAGKLLSLDQFVNGVDDTDV